MRDIAEYWYDELSLYTGRRGGKTDAMRNWVRDKFGVNRVKTNPTQEQRLAPERPQPVGIRSWPQTGSTTGRMGRMRG